VLLFETGRGKEGKLKVMLYQRFKQREMIKNTQMKR
jgi:hypothetical protein